MKRGYMLLLMVLYVSPLISAGYIGVSPAKVEIDFEPSSTQQYTFRAMGEKNKTMTLNLSGVLAPYASLDKLGIKGPEGLFTVTLRLPDSLEKPGVNTLYISVSEEIEEASSGVATQAVVNAPIRVFVPFPGEYIEAAFTIDDINEGEDVLYQVQLKNRGSRTTLVKPRIVIYEGSEKNDEKKIIEKNLLQKRMGPTEALNLDGVFKSSEFVPGTYLAIATVEYGQEVIEIEKSFRVGSKSIEIVDYDFEFIKDKINSFNVLAKSEWNSQMKGAYANIKVTDNGVIVSDITSAPVNIDAWNQINFTGFFDTTGLESKRYLANIVIHFEDNTENKLVAIYVRDPPQERNYLLISVLAIGGFIGLLLVIIILILMIKLKRVQRNGKKKK